MSSTPYRCSDALFAGSGVVRFGVVTLGPVSREADAAYNRWLKQGRHASMEYLARHADIRRDPQLLLDGAQSMVCCAIPYPRPAQLPPRQSKIAAYALGRDYHEVVRQQLETVATRLREAAGGATRVCVDTAPLRERYWAVQAGVGFIGLNNQLIVPGIGSCVFLGEIITTAPLEPTPALDTRQCEGCMRCIKACPTGAIGPDGYGADARKCLSYLTIEHRGEFPPGTDLHGQLYGCDICAAVCPHNRGEAQAPILPDLEPRQALLDITTDQALEMTQEQFSHTFSHSAVKRTKLAGLQRNAATLATKKHAP